uniref:Voltage-dependent calcium channel beta subunit-associated regulatory protein isoform X1 n=1 Tax=Geotrypetes seraphini TaxID=260995 RepID=A0A6P8S4R6_GEOSA|nr:voltage-dependent calcium channel beta subunit-associated regulatory protein isoform X1 [Geotrypetes seraphini]XP_033812986.1 voltage-dependent calcium channel beta subunit-associated regulatory protein isoform X1 [Geotrypetes seraphini]
MSDEFPVWQNISVTPTTASSEVGVQDGYALLLVLLSVFIGGTVVLLAGILIICRHCCETGRRYSRASDDPEKTTTTYLDDTQPPQEITIRVEESDCLSTSSYHDAESERFLSTCSTGRRVSFNEAALFDQSKKAQEKGRRYTLTEGDFHHLKNARLTHLHIPSPALKIVTIHECESSENNIAMTTCMSSTSRSTLSIFQSFLSNERDSTHVHLRHSLMSSLPQTALGNHPASPSSALPGDTYNSTVETTESGEEAMFCVAGRRLSSSSGTTAGVSSPPQSQGSVLQFFTRLRRHASLESASPYFKIKKWKLDSSQRASSLDMRGSPKRSQFQRQRAASESMEQEDWDPHQTDIIQYIARTDNVAFNPLQHPASPPPSLGRLEAVEMVGSSGEPPNSYHDIWSLRASLELHNSSEYSSSNEKDSVRSDGESICSLGATPSLTLQDLGPDTDGMFFLGATPGFTPQYMGPTANGVCSLGVTPSLTLEDLQPSMDGLCSARTTPSLSPQGSGSAANDTWSLRGITGLISQNLDRDKDHGKPLSQPKQDSIESDRGSDSETGTRKLLQMDSGYASIEAPSRLPEDSRLFGAPVKDKTASEKRLSFTSAGRTGTVCESFEFSSFPEELEEDGAMGGEPGSPGAWAPHGQMFANRDLHLRRDYSIDEKTDALFNEFLRHDPQFDDSPPRSKHRSRIHLRKQWQRTKQYSDPGVRLAPALERQRTPLRRGDSVNYPPAQNQLHSMLAHTTTIADQGFTVGPLRLDPEDQIQVIEEEPNEQGSTLQEPMGPVTDPQEPGDGPQEAIGIKTDPQEPGDDLQENMGTTTDPQELEGPRIGHHLNLGYGPQTFGTELLDKLTTTIEEQLYMPLRRSKESPECVVVVAHTSPHHSPV